MNLLYEKQVGQNIRRLRKYHELSQDQLAARLQVGGCDVTRSALAKIEVGQRHLYVDEIILLKDILNTTYDVILQVNETNETEQKDREP